MPEIHTPREATLTVAASDSREVYADYRCDGTADEVQINAALAAGYKVVLMEGNFNIAAPITKAVANATLEGQGKGTIITLANGSDCHMITIGGDSWAIKNLYIDGNETNQSDGIFAGIYANAKDNFLIDNVEVYDTKQDGMRLYACLHFHVRDCYAHGCGYEVGNGAGIHPLYDCYDFSIIGCESNDNTDSGIKVTNCYTGSIVGCIGRNNGYCNLDVGGGSGNESYSINVSGFVSDRQADSSGVRFDGARYCTLNGIVHYGAGGTDADMGILIMNSQHITLDGFAVYFPGDEGIGVHSDTVVCKHIIIANGTILNAGGQEAAYSGIIIYTESALDIEDILVDNVSIEDDRGTKFMDYGVTIKTNDAGKPNRVTISNCHITNVDDDGILLEAGDNIRIVDNTITGGTIGIHLDDGDDCMIQNNRIDGVTTSIDINNANVVRCQVQGNNWEGCTNNPSYAAATTPRFNYNINIAGAWWSVNDSQPTTRSIVLTAQGGKPSATAGCGVLTEIEMGTNKQSPYILPFDGAGVEYAEWNNIVLPPGYNGGTVTAIFHWTGEAGAGTVIWGLQAISYADDDPLDAAWGGAIEVTDTFLAADDEHKSPATAAITIAGSPVAGQLVFFRAYRDGATDTKSEDAKLMSIEVSYTGK